MLTRAIQLSRTINMLKPLRYGFCIFSKPHQALSPEKHTYMNHNPNNSKLHFRHCLLVYDDEIPLGEFPYVMDYA